MSPKLPRINASQLLRALHRDGWEEFRQTGSHLHLTHPARPGTLVTIALHANQDIPVGTLSAILKQAGMTADDLRALL